MYWNEKSAPNVPRDKPQNCQKNTCLFYLPESWIQNEKSPSNPQHKKHSQHSQHCTVLKETREKQLSRASTWDTGGSECPHCSGTLESLISSNPASGNGQEPGKHPLRLTRFQFGICSAFSSPQWNLVSELWPICEQGLTWAWPLKKNCLSGT